MCHFIYSSDMNPSNTELPRKKSTKTPVFIAIIVVLLAALAGLGYYSYSIQQQYSQLEEQQSASEQELRERIGALEKSTADIVGPTNSPDTAPEGKNPVDETAAIVAAATQFADSNGLAYHAPLQVSERYGEFADVTLTSAGMTLKRIDGTWTVVTHGQQLNLDDARTHGIPIDTSSALYQSLTPAEREGLVTR